MNEFLKEWSIKFASDIFLKKRFGDLVNERLVYT